MAGSSWRALPLTQWLWNDPVPALKNIRKLEKTMNVESIIAAPAVALVEQLAGGALTPHDLLDALAERIAVVKIGRAHV